MGALQTAALLLARRDSQDQRRQASSQGVSRGSMVHPKRPGFILERSVVQTVGAAQTDFQAVGRVLDQPRQPLVFLSRVEGLAGHGADKLLEPPGQRGVGGGDVGTKQLQELDCLFRRQIEDGQGNGFGRLVLRRFADWRLLLFRSLVSAGHRA